jgi:THAP4-like, heme-binding beta-barrel domain
MNKPTLGVAVGSILGVLDGASAWAYPEARAMILVIVVSSTIKGALTGLLAGVVARRVRSLTVGLAAGLVIGTALSFLAAAGSPAGPDGSKHYAEIVLPGMLLGAIVGFITQRFPKDPSTTLRTPPAILAIMLLGMPAMAAVTAQDHVRADDLQPLSFLLGSWRGTSEGKPGRGSVDREYKKALNGRFIQIHNRSVYEPQPSNPKGEVHEDVGFISFDRVRRRFVLRQFHVEGFVNQYVSEPTAARTWVFTSEAIENIAPGWRARETYTITSPTEVEEVFELAEPGKEFEVYSRTRLARTP